MPTFTTTSVEDIFYQQTLSAPDGVASDAFGFVAVSGDGKTLAVGASNESTSPYTSNGAVYIYTRTSPDNSWEYQTKLFASDVATNASFGKSVALSYNGSILVVGSPATSSPGAIYIFTGSERSWTQQQKITEATSLNNGLFTAISGDGSTIVTRGLTASNTQSSFYVYTKPASTWTLQQSIALGGLTTICDISISYNGNVFVSGDTSTGFIYTRSGSTWTQTKSYSGNFDSLFGYSNSISADGTIAVFGAPYDDKAYIAKFSGSAWPAAFANLTTITPPSGHTGLDYFGDSVAVSSEGSTIYVGAHAYPSNVGPGCVYVYYYNGTSATFFQRILASSFGLSGTANYFAGDPNELRVSANGTTLVIAANGNGSVLGNVYTYFTGKNVDNNYYSYNGVSTAWEVSKFEQLNSPSVTNFTSSGTFTIPIGAKVIKVTCIGAGGGGGGGARNSTIATYSGGSGGAGGGISDYIFRAQDLGGAGASVTVTVGTGGAGGAVTATGTTALAGNAGVAGGTTSISLGASTFLQATGGGAGAGGVTTGLNYVGASGFGMFGGNGAGYPSELPGGGQGGQGSSSGSGASGGIPVSSTLTAATGSAGANGGAGQSNAYFNGGGGGGAGGASNTTNGFTGGAGGSYGGGGGGGGEGSTAGASGRGGAGGVGGVGLVTFMVWYG